MPATRWYSSRIGGPHDSLSREVISAFPTVSSHFPLDSRAIFTSQHVRGHWSNPTMLTALPVEIVQAKPAACRPQLREFMPLPDTKMYLMKQRRALSKSFRFKQRCPMRDPGNVNQGPTLVERRLTRCRRVSHGRSSLGLRIFGDELLPQRHWRWDWEMFILNLSPTNVSSSSDQRSSRNAKRNGRELKSRVQCEIFR